MAKNFLERLARAGLLRTRLEEAAAVLRPSERPAAGLLRLCHAGLLEGGLSVASDVRPDELMGPLLHALGGSAQRLKLVDVRDRPSLELQVLVGGAVERWDVPDLPALLHHLNDLHRAASGVKRAALLGEWEDALQLWCIPRKALTWLRREDAFAPLNLAAL